MRDQIFLWIKVMNLALGEIMFNLGLGHDLNIFPHYKFLLGLKDNLLTLFLIFHIIKVNQRIIQKEIILITSMIP